MARPSLSAKKKRLPGWLSSAASCAVLKATRRYCAMSAAVLPLAKASEKVLRPRRCNCGSSGRPMALMVVVRMGCR